MAEGWKEIRVFISSTFRDMQAERDHLVRFVFPRLREKLHRRQLRLVDIDLRWGVTADQDAFDLCMTEIELCRPRFLCMLGGRYGWVPAPRAIAANALEGLLNSATAVTAEERAAITRLYMRSGDAYELAERPQTKDAVERYHADGQLAVAAFQRAGIAGANLSITASEVLHGALDELDAPLFRFFYFRDPAITSAIPEAFAPDYREPSGSFSERALEDLKLRIADPDTKGRVLVAPGVTEERPLPVFVYPCAWDDRTGRITALHEFGARVEADLLASIDAELGPEVAPLEGFAAEAAAMDAFIESRVQRYVMGSREQVFAELSARAVAAAPSEITTVVGEAGSGKSALLARFARDHTAAHPQDLVITHFVGASASSTNARHMLRRLWHELITGAGLESDELAAIPDDWDKLRTGFPAVLARAAAQRPVLLIIDAVNQLEAAYQAHTMTWLPETLPAGVHVIVSILPGPALDALKARRAAPHLIALERLTRADVVEIVERFLERYRKTLDAEQRAALLSKTDASNALYLLSALEELRTLGTYEEITDRIQELPPETVPLFEWILQRLEQDPGFRNAQGELIGAGVVRDFCKYLAVSRSCMSESELAELVAPAEAGADSAGNVAALARLLRPYLMYGGNLLKFFHTQIDAAVRNRYLQRAEAGRAAHAALAAFFRRKADPAGALSWSGAESYPRSVGELPYHLTEAQRWDELQALLTDLGFVEAKCTYVGVQEVSAAGERTKVFGGVYELQDDYRRALEMLPG